VDNLEISVILKLFWLRNILTFIKTQRYSFY